ncbi:MAG: glutamate 5-kinase [Leptospiraceae bacterium]|nr:glutamate 5-kinase [Leptospiraceae bacterium]MDW7975940.1 glutamate 5-kinase [Leptospiraceae bacterium]
MNRSAFLSEWDQIKRIVIKIGSNLIVDPNTEQIQFDLLNHLIDEILFLRNQQKEVILVSSGAIALGKKKIKTLIQNDSYQNPSVIKKQALASIGQIELMKFYQNLFDEKKILISQILITAKDFRDRETYLNIGHTLQEILKLNVLPVINENDTVSTDEIKFGDNDFLSAAVAALLNSQLLILLTSVEGFLINNQRVSFLDKIDSEIIKHAKGPQGFGSGGMYSKIKVGKLCQQAGLHLAILPGKEKHVLRRFYQGDDIGTLIYSTKRFLRARKKWLLFSRSKGAIIVDEGAEKALRYKNSSLLWAGIKNIEGSFTYGDVVEIKNQKQEILGRGIINIPSRILRNRLNHEQYPLKEFFPFEVIHRDDLILED